jgi:hypothetical protein
MLSSSRFADEYTSGLDERKIRTAIKHDANGSHPAHPQKLVNIVDTITDTLPKVSARICK